MSRNLQSVLLVLGGVVLVVALLGALSVVGTVVMALIGAAFHVAFALIGAVFSLAWAFLKLLFHPLVGLVVLGLLVFYVLKRRGIRAA